MGHYSIRDLEYLSGIKAHTIRIWEQRYDIVSPKRTATNIRYYDDFDLRRLLNVSFLNQNGYKISQIAKLSYDEVLALVDKIAITYTSHETQISTLILAMVNLDERRFHQILKLHTQEDGFEKTALQLIFPFLERVGILWQTGDVNAAQEHFISGLIRQKLLAAIDNIPVQTDADRRFLLFLPEDEWHEIGLLFAYYLIKVRNHRVIYLGQSLPFQDIISTVTSYQPHVLVSSITSVPANQKAIEYANRLLDTFPQCEIILSGYQITKQKELMPEKVKTMNNIQELIAYLSQ